MVDVPAEGGVPVSSRVLRPVIEVNPGQCIGCGLCLPDCPNHALAIPDGTSRLLDERLCDGCGACVDACPEGALHVVEKEVCPFDLSCVIERARFEGDSAVDAFLAYLEVHGQEELLCRAREVLGVSEDDSPGRG